MSEPLSPNEAKLTEDNLNKMIPTHGFKDEKHFQREFTKTLKEFGYFVKKLSDSDRSHKPCDCFVIGPDQITFWFELKYIEKYIFNTDHLRPNQVDFLRNVVPGFHVIGIYSKIMNNICWTNIAQLTNACENAKSKNIQLFEPAVVHFEDHSNIKVMNEKDIENYNKSHIVQRPKGFKIEK